MTPALLDRCLTGWPRMGRAAFLRSTNQWFARPLLLDSRLTGGAANAGCFPREALHFVLDARIDRETLGEQDFGIGKVDYEIHCNCVFFQYQPPRPLHEIDAELAGVEQRILELLREVTE